MYNDVMDTVCVMQVYYYTQIAKFVIFVTYFIVSTTLQKIIIIFIRSIDKRNTEINLE